MTGGMVQAVKHLICRCEAQVQTPGPPTKQNKQKRNIQCIIINYGHMLCNRSQNLFLLSLFLSISISPTSIFLLPHTSILYFYKCKFLNSACKWDHVVFEYLRFFNYCQILICVSIFTDLSHTKSIFWLCAISELSTLISFFSFHDSLVFLACVTSLDSPGIRHEKELDVQKDSESEKKKEVVELSWQESSDCNTVSASPIGNHGIHFWEKWPRLCSPTLSAVRIAWPWLESWGRSSWS
jgi:hypothetical protein